MYPYIVKAHYWDDFEEPWVLKHIQVLVYASSATDAVRQVEDNQYISNIEDIKAISAGDDGQLFEVPGHIAKILAAGAAIYRDGLEAMETNEKIAKKLREDADKIAPRGFFTENFPCRNPNIEKFNQEDI